MTSRAPSALLARDAYRLWRQRVEAAQTSIVVFSPYLDDLLVHLLGHSPLPVNQATVVTDLSPRSGALDYFGQLKAIRKLIALGVPVRSLPRLHAKVLQVDRTSITLGSQNFTSYARRSKETTAGPAGPVSDKRFLNTLDAWLAASTDVPIELVDCLLAKLAAEAKSVLVATTDLEAAYNDLIVSFELEEQARREAEREAAARREAERQAAARRRSKEWFETLTRQSSVRLAQSTAWASVKTVGSWDSGFYEALVADREYNLTEWVDSKSGSQSSQELSRLRMYPILLQESGRMGFARVGRERISYVRSGVVWNRHLTIDGWRTQVTTRFPETGLTRRNIELEFQPAGWGPAHACTVNVLFDGLEFRVVDEVANPESPDYAEAVRSFLSTRKTLFSFVQQYFKAFKYSELGRAHHNAGDFFTGNRFRIGLIEFASTPFFLVSRFR